MEKPWGGSTLPKTPFPVTPQVLQGGYHQPGPPHVLRFITSLKGGDGQEVRVVKDDGQEVRVAKPLFFPGGDNKHIEDSVFFLREVYLSPGLVCYC